MYASLDDKVILVYLFFAFAARAIHFPGDDPVEAERNEDHCRKLKRHNL